MCPSRKGSWQALENLCATLQRPLVSVDSIAMSFNCCPICSLVPYACVFKQEAQLAGRSFWVHKSSCMNNVLDCGDDCHFQWKHSYDIAIYKAKLSCSHIQNPRASVALHIVLMFCIDVQLSMFDYRSLMNWTGFNEGFSFSVVEARHTIHGAYAVSQIRMLQPISQLPTTFPAAPQRAETPCCKAFRCNVLHRGCSSDLRWPNEQATSQRTRKAIQSVNCTAAMRYTRQAIERANRQRSVRPDRQAASKNGSKSVQALARVPICS
jgi:hypothetical protein